MRESVRESLDGGGDDDDDDDVPLIPFRAGGGSANAKADKAEKVTKKKKRQSESSSTKDLTHHMLPMLVSAYGIEAASATHRNARLFFMGYCQDAFHVEVIDLDQRRTNMMSQNYIKIGRAHV